MLVTNTEPEQPVPVLLFKNFSFQYKTQAAPTLHNIDLEIMKGEKILVVGPSGSGKTTIGHCINGLIPQAFPGTIQGHILLNSKNLHKMGIFDISKHVGTVLQDPDSQFVGLSAGEDIAFILENNCVPQNEMQQRVLKAAKLVHIEDHLEKSPQDLSGGQKQRVSMAGVLIDDVDILLFDEPLANLDPATGKEAIELIDQLHRETGKTIIIIEHRIEDVLHRNIDRIIVIDEGKIRADLPPAELLAGNILKETGIREPLYISALRYAGIEIKSEDKSDHIETIQFDTQKLKTWEESLPIPAPMKEQSVLLKLDNITFSYDKISGKDTLSDASLVVHKGESLSLVGKNGAGKSTLANIICGFLKPDKGAMFFDQRDMANDSIKERSLDIGYVMQNPNKMISFPLIYDEAALALRSRGMNENEVKDKVFDTLKICGLYPYRNWPVSALSFGQKKRLTIASILVTGPKLLILDEPTAGQDFRHYSEIMEFLKKLNEEQGLALLMITHDMHLMLEYTTRAIALSDGNIIADASPASILTDDDVVEKANLKRTSLYDLAMKAGIENPQLFVEQFIRHERERGFR
jgi:energy-coupling factor transport system ATP-binding protein